MTIDSSKELDLYPIDYPFETLVERITKDKIILNPEFQRDYCWDKNGHERGSKFIESCLMRIPIPACYFAEDEKKNHLVIDGVQRLTTLKNFLNDEFALEGLTFYSELNGKKFSEFSIGQKNDLLNYTVRCIILRNTNQDAMIREIFARLNQGSVQLSSQEIRHALYNSKFDQLLKDLADEYKTDLSKFTGGTKSSNRQEFILRFFAFLNDPSLEEYHDNLKLYLDDFMSSKKMVEDDEVQGLREKFITALENCKKIFGEKAFSNPNGQKNKGIFAYYDLLMLSLSGVPIDFLGKKVEVRKAFRQLSGTTKFKNTLAQGTQRKSTIIERRRLWEDKISTILK